jgi:hypothetical protein
MLLNHRPEFPDTLDLVEFFDGDVEAWGIFEDLFGRLRQRFTVSIRGRMQDGVFIMNEDFANDDGSCEARVWRIFPRGEHRFVAEADDILGQAEGTLDGPAARMSYTYRLPVGSRSLAVRFHDRMYRLDADTVVNTARVSKWGLTLGRVTLFFRRRA